MAKRRNRKKHPILWTLLIVLLAGIMLAVGIGTRVYMQHTGTDFWTALKQTVRLGGQYAVNLLSSAENSVSVNPYQPSDYYRRGELLHCSTSEASFAGVDVSSHQAEIDWQAVADAGVDFAIIRVGYRGYSDGEMFADSTALDNLRGAQAAGLDVGVYFFSQATSEQEAQEEASFVLNAIEGYDIRYPVLFDWEYIGEDARTAQVTGPELTQFALRFCETVKNAGYTAGVYFNQDFGYNRFDLRALRDYEFWLAEYADAQSFAYDVSLWQYNCEAHLPGIDATVDLNLCYRDYSKPQAEQ